MRAYRHQDGTYSTWIDFSIYTPVQADIPEFLQRRFGISFTELIDAEEALPDLEGRMRYYDWKQEVYPVDDELFGTDVHVMASEKPVTFRIPYDEDATGFASDDLNRLLLPSGVPVNERLYDVLQEEDAGLTLFTPDDVALVYGTMGRPSYLTIIEKYQRGPIDEVFIVKPHLEEMAQVADILVRHYDGIVFNGQEWGESTPEKLQRLIDGMESSLQRQESFSPREYRLHLV